MYSFGKTDGSFRCSASATGKCWNRVYCMRERVYPAVLEAVVKEVLSLDGVRGAVLARVKELHEKGGAVAAEFKTLYREEKRLLAAIERLSAAVERGDVALASLTSRRPLRQAAAAADERPVMFERSLVVNAYAEPQLVKHARVIVERRLAGKTYKAIAQELDLTNYHMEKCAAIVRLMESAGLAEPYRRLTEKPDHVPQWCSKHWLKAGDRKGGGKRRRAS
jgi:hypothetical protein